MKTKSDTTHLLLDHNCSHINMQYIKHWSQAFCIPVSFREVLTLFSANTNEREFIYVLNINEEMLATNIVVDIRLVILFLHIKPVHAVGLIKAKKSGFSTQT